MGINRYDNIRTHNRGMIGQWTDGALVNIMPLQPTVSTRRIIKNKLMKLTATKQKGVVCTVCLPVHDLVSSCL